MSSFLVEEIGPCECARLTEDLLEKAFRMNIRKALDPLDPDDFLVISARLARALAKVSRPDQARALKAALEILDVDWLNITPKARREVIRAARGVVVGLPQRIIHSITRELEVRGSAIVRGARRSVKARTGASIGVNMALQDQRIVNHLSSSQGFFVTNQYIERAEFFSARARNIVAEGLSQGLGQDEIARMLRAEIGDALGPARSGRYWNVIANVFVNRARTYGQLASYAEAGIERYIFSSILDEVTTEQCRLLDGKVWEVRKGLQQYADVEASSDPQAVKDIMPWFRTGRDENGDRVIYTQNQAGERTIMARVLESGIGERDRIGRYETTRAFNEMSAVSPPLHALCRSTIVADI